MEAWQDLLWRPLAGINFRSRARGSEGLGLLGSSVMAHTTLVFAWSSRSPIDGPRDGGMYMDLYW